MPSDMSRRTSYGVYISQLIRFARASSNLNDFNYRNKALTTKLLRQGYRYFKLRKAFSKFYRRHSALLEQEAHGPRFAHLSDIATAGMQMLCNIFPILSSQLIEISSFEQFLVLKKNIWA